MSVMYVIKLTIGIFWKIHFNVTTMVYVLIACREYLEIQGVAPYADPIYVMDLIKIDYFIVLV